MFNQYFKKLNGLLNTIELAEGENIIGAAQKIAGAIQSGGIVHVFGCGHSHMFGEELFYRAGGLVPINPILIENAMLHKGAVSSTKFEKANNMADKFMEDIDLQPEDVMIVVSTSGRNPVPIDVAEFAKKNGIQVIVITSLIYKESVTSRHKSGKYLCDVADVVIDNHIRVGDTLMEHEEFDVSFGSGSTVVGAALVNGLMVEAIKIMIENNFYPPIFKSSNADGDEGHNQRLIDKYKGRIPLLNR